MCGVITSVDQCALCASSTHDVHHAIVGVNVVIGVLVVNCELLVVRVDPVVVCDVVVRRTLVLIALHRSHCFRRSHFSKNFAVWGIYCLQISENEYFSGSKSVQVLFPIGTVLGKEPAGSLLCGFALAFDRHAKSFASIFNAYSSS